MQLRRLRHAPLTACPTLLFHRRTDCANRTGRAVPCCIQTTMETPDNIDTLSQKIDIPCLVIYDSGSILVVECTEDMYVKLVIETRTSVSHGSWTTRSPSVSEGKLLRVFRSCLNARGILDPKRLARLKSDLRIADRRNN